MTLLRDFLLAIIFVAVFSLVTEFVRGYGDAVEIMEGNRK